MRNLILFLLVINFGTFCDTKFVNFTDINLNLLLNILLFLPECKVELQSFSDTGEIIKIKLREIK